jgi:hypothetical protein
MNYRFILGWCLLGMLCNPALAAKVYTWTDTQGVTHYGEHPPKDVTAKIINARTGHSEPVPVETPATEEAQAQTQSADQVPTNQPRKDPERCDIARKNLETLKGNARIRMPDGDGNMRLLSPEERDGKLAEMEKAIEESCE